jgi:hypothetical protein
VQLCQTEEVVVTSARRLAFWQYIALPPVPLWQEERQAHHLVVVVVV